MSRGDSGKRRHREKPRHDLIEACDVSGGKLRYPSRKKALTALNHLRTLKMPTHPTGVYKCRHCADWHLTSRAIPKERAA